MNQTERLKKKKMKIYSDEQTEKRQEFSDDDDGNKLRVLVMGATIIIFC